jgi:hypothetical protein
MIRAGPRFAAVAVVDDEIGLRLCAGFLELCVVALVEV